MQPLEKIYEYTKSVCGHVKWKKAHPVIAEEIENHIYDQRDAYIADGDNESTATDKAIAQMGDPDVIGAQFNHTHRPKPQLSMILLTVALLLIGILIRMFIIRDHDQWQVSAIAAAIGLGVMACVYFSDFALIGKYPRTVYLLILAISVLVLMLSPVVNGKALYAGFMPLLFPLGFAAIVYAVKGKGYQGIILCGICFIMPACVAWYVPSISGIFLFAVSGLFILCVAISKKWFRVKALYGYLLVIIPVVVITVLALAVISNNDYRWDRLRAAFDPSVDPQGAGYIGMLIKTLIAGSRLVGHGSIPASSTANWLGNSTDYLLTYLIYNVGWISFIIIMGLLIFFITKGFISCFRQKSGLALFVSLSVMLTFTLQAAGYVLSNLGFQLFAPISLPLISNGNIAAIINLMLIGIMLSVFRTGDAVRDKGLNNIGKNSFITYGDGKIIISLHRK